MVRKATSGLKDPLHQRYDVMSKESCRDVLRRPQILVGWNVRKGALRIRPATPFLDLGERLCILARLAELFAIGTRFRMCAKQRTRAVSPLKPGMRPSSLRIMASLTSALSEVTARI